MPRGEIFNFRDTYTRTNNDVTKKDPEGIFTSSEGAFHLENLLQFSFGGFWGVFKGEMPPQLTEAVKKKPSGSFQLVISCDIIDGP